MDREDIERLARGYLLYTEWFLVVGRAEFDLRARAASRRAVVFQTEAAADGETLAPAVLGGVVEPAHGPEEAVARDAERIIAAGGPDAWPLLKQIVLIAPEDEHLLTYLGAGLFENWVTEPRLEAVFEELAGLLRTSPRWQTVARASWNVPPGLAALLQPV